jgi:hypothetical protein
VARNAAEDADCVGQFLTVLGRRIVEPSGIYPQLRLPIYFLLGLGAALRLLMWEKKGLQAHRDAGLPSSRELLYRVFQWLSDPAPATVKEQNARTLCAQVLQVFVERFAWDGQALLQADFVLGQAEEEQLVEALAQFLWHQRHVGEGLDWNG